MLLAAVATGAWAQTETLLTTITPTAKEQASYSTANVATVSFSNLPSTATNTYGSDYLANWGWWGYGWSATVNAAEGYTITKCIFYDDKDCTATDSEAPFVVETEKEDKTPRVNGTPIKADQSKGIKKIEVYGYVTPTYSVTLAEGTEDAENWKVKVGKGEAQAFPVEGLDGGETVTITYSGEKKVKSVKAVKKGGAVDPAKAYMTWDADQKKLVATEIPAEATKVENSTSYVEWSGTYVVEGNVTISGQITLSGNVNLIIKDGATLTAQGGIRGYNNNLYIYGQANQTGQLVVDKSDDDAITSMKTLEVHSAKLTATSSKKDRGGFYYAGTINVYGGSVDATAANGYGISLRSDGSINIYGGEVKAVGKGTGSYGYGITAGNTATVTVNGGKLWAENADKKALNTSFITLKKGEGFTGKIEYSSDKSTWSETVDANAKYVRVGYN